MQVLRTLHIQGYVLVTSGPESRINYMCVCLFKKGKVFRGSLCLAHHVGSLCKRQFISGTLAKMTLGLAVGMRSERLGVLLCIVCLFCDTSFDIKVCKLQMSLCSVLTTPRISPCVLIRRTSYRMLVQEIVLQSHHSSDFVASSYNTRL